MGVPVEERRLGGGSAGPYIARGAAVRWPLFQKCGDGLVKSYGPIDGCHVYVGVCGVRNVARVTSLSEEAGGLAGAAAGEYLVKTWHFERNAEVPKGSAVATMLEDVTDDAIKADLRLCRLLLGSKGAGTDIHRHYAVHNALLEGRKRWLFVPPDRYGSVSASRLRFESMEDWLETSYPELEGQLGGRECIQEAGDVVYVPEDYYHAAVSLCSTIGLAFEKHRTA